MAGNRERHKDTIDLGVIAANVAANPGQVSRGDDPRSDPRRHHNDIAVREEIPLHDLQAACHFGPRFQRASASDLAAVEFDPDEGDSSSVKRSCRMSDESVARCCLSSGIKGFTTG